MISPIRTEPLLRVSELRRDYFQRGPWGRQGRTVPALAGVDLQVERGSTLAIVGRSGSGKSTLARCIAGLEAADAGKIQFQGRPVPRCGDPEARWLYRQVQLVLQDSATALNARFTAEEIVAEPLVIQRLGDARQRRARVLSLLDDVGLARDLAGRRPRQLSGGQRQRLAIARALAVEPSLLIFDESFSGLDLRVQEQIARLLRELQVRRGLTFIFISHDLCLMAAIASEIAIMCEGRIVETGATADVLRHPIHPQARALVAAMPTVDRANASGVGC